MVGSTHHTPTTTLMGPVGGVACTTGIVAHHHHNDTASTKEQVDDAAWLMELRCPQVGPGGPATVLGMQMHLADLSS